MRIAPNRASVLRSASIDNASTLGGTWVDGANPYPGGGTSENPLTDQDIQGEIVRALAANPGWPPPSLSSAYFVFTEPGVASCADPTACTPGVPISGPLAQFYCAYHSSFELGGRDVIYANMPFGATLPGCCGVRASPNGDASADTEICLASHEHFEMATDPLATGWYNGDLCEIGDKCVARYGAFQPDGHNVVLNGNPYVVQLEWSNADGDGVSRSSGCVRRYGADVDLAVGALGSPDRVTTGDVVTYAISVQDLNETFEGTDLDLVDLLPAGTALRSPILPAGWSCAEQPTGGTIGCTKQSLAAGMTDMLRLQAAVDCSIADGTLLTNAAVECTAKGGTPADDPGLGVRHRQLPRRGPGERRAGAPPARHHDRHLRRRRQRRRTLLVPIVRDGPRHETSGDPCDAGCVPPLASRSQAGRHRGRCRGLRRLRSPAHLRPDLHNDRAMLPRGRPAHPCNRVPPGAVCAE